MIIYHMAVPSGQTKSKSRCICNNLIDAWDIPALHGVPLQSAPQAAAAHWTVHQSQILTIQNLKSDAYFAFPSCAFYLYLLSCSSSHAFDPDHEPDVNNLKVCLS